MAVTDGFGFPVSTDESGLGTKFWHKGNIHVELVLLALRLEHEFGIKLTLLLAHQTSKYVQYMFI